MNDPTKSAFSSLSSFHRTNAVISCRALLGLLSLSASLLACSQKDPASADDTAPADTAPADTAPADTAPADTAPADTAPADPVDDSEPADDAPAADDTTEPDPPAPPNSASYYPLADGASWTYRHTSLTDGQWVELVTMTATTYNGAEAWLVRDSEDLAGEVGVQTWQMVGTAVSRVYREQFESDALKLRVTYDPGFVRFDTAWTQVGQTSANQYRREERKPDNTGSAAVRTMDFVVVETAGTASVPAGDYSNCLVVDRTRLDNQDTSRFWFAEGVGKVREEDLSTGTTEELTEFTIP